ncbi:MAG TPA: J domain-containing protein [Longimicrobiales bacterium]
MTDAYPLAWPQGWPRTKFRQPSKFRTTLSAALKNVQAELTRLGAKNVVLSSNVCLGNEKPTDPGVAVYFVRDGRQLCIPCDAWTKVEDNLQAIARTIEALRGIERWGAKHTVDAAFAGFAALPPPGERISDHRWYVVLGVTPDATPAQVEAAYRDLARRYHPDVAPDGAARMAAINAARDAYKRERHESP